MAAAGGPRGDSSHCLVCNVAVTEGSDSRNIFQHSSLAQRLQPIIQVRESIRPTEKNSGINFRCHPLRNIGRSALSSFFLKKKYHPSFTNFSDKNFLKSHENCCSGYLNATIVFLLAFGSGRIQDKKFHFVFNYLILTKSTIGNSVKLGK